MRTSFGIQVSHLKPTKKHRVAMWAILGSVVAINDQDEVQVFSGLAAWAHAAEFAGASSDRDPRVGTVHSNWNHTIGSLDVPYRPKSAGQHALFILK